MSVPDGQVGHQATFAGVGRQASLPSHMATYKKEEVKHIFYGDAQSFFDSSGASYPQAPDASLRGLRRSCHLQPALTCGRPRGKTINACDRSWASALGRRRTWTSIGGRIEDNLTKLRPETLKKINDLMVRAGHVLEPEAIEAVRADTFVVETNIHYPTESSLIGDGMPKVLPLAARLAKAEAVAGWRQHEHWLDKVKKLVRNIGRASRAKNEAGKAHVKAGYEELLATVAPLLERAGQLLISPTPLGNSVPAS
jgi:hypothetical protein